MRNVAKALAVSGVFCLGFAVKPALSWAQAGPHPDVIYGDDDRLDLYQVDSAVLLGLADSTVGLFQAGDVSVQDGVAALGTSNYGDSYRLCQDEPFRDQNSGAFCSGSLVAPDVIMTAGHCVKSQSACTGIKFVFGFSIKEAGGDPEHVPAGDVYGCSQLLGRTQENYGPDWALVKLDRPVEGHNPLKISEQAPAKGTPLFVIGHPAGLPTKIAGGAAVRDPSPNGYFVANLDTYGGNSGSAVFNGVTGRVEGILVRGENDFVWDSANYCRRSNVCDSDGCRGEDVTKVAECAPTIPAWGPAAVMSKPGAALRSLLQLSAVK